MKYTISRAIMGHLIWWRAGKRSEKKSPKNTPHAIFSSLFLSLSTTRDALSFPSLYRFLLASELLFPPASLSQRRTINRRTSSGLPPLLQATTPPPGKHEKPLKPTKGDWANTDMPEPPSPFARSCPLPPPLSLALSNSQVPLIPLPFSPPPLAPYAQGPVSGHPYNIKRSNFPSLISGTSSSFAPCTVSDLLAMLALNFMFFFVTPCVLCF